MFDVRGLDLHRLILSVERRVATSEPILSFGLLPSLRLSVTGPLCLGTHFCNLTGTFSGTATFLSEPIVIMGTKTQSYLRRKVRLVQACQQSVTH